MNDYYLDVITQTNNALKAINSSYQVSFRAAWSPNGIDGRYYNYQKLAEVTDFLFVMCYDTRSQIFDQCVASANAPVNICKKGIEEYLLIGVEPKKLILGIPWYGYRYECIAEGFNPVEDQTCEIVQVPFRGVNCSGAAGSEHTYGEIRGLVNGGSMTSPLWRDNYMDVPFFNYVDSTTGKIYQIWYDDVQSLTPIYKYAKDMGLRGTGPDRFDQLDLANNMEESEAMFDALNVAK